MSETSPEAVTAAADRALPEPATADSAGELPEPATADLAGELPELAQEFVAALAREQQLAERREGVITRLHEELEQLRRGEVEQALDLVRRPLIRLHDQILRQAELVDGPLSVEELRALLRALADETADALAATGVDRYTAQVGEAYDVARHRPVGRVAAESPEQDRTVGRAVTAGFAQGDRVVRKSEVFVTRWEA